MTHHTLREIAKFLSGMAAAKVLFILWLTSAGLAPVVLAGTPFTTDSLVPATIFNVALLAILVYYGWHVKSPVHSPTERTLLSVVGVLLLAVAAVHLLRLLTGTTIVFGDVSIPLWLSWIGLVLTAYLSYSSFHFAFRMKGAKR